MTDSFASPPSCAHIGSMHIVSVWFGPLLSCCDLTPCCLCLARFDYCRFIELDYVAMETDYMVSMRQTKSLASSNSPTNKSPDRHSRATNSPSTPRSRSVLSPLLSSLSVFTFWSMLRSCTAHDVTTWKPSDNRLHSIMSRVPCYSLLLLFCYVVFSYLFYIK